jgi:hypothetical protein
MKTALLKAKLLILILCAQARCFEKKSLSIMHVLYIICLSTAGMSKWGVKWAAWWPFHFWQPMKLCETNCECDSKSTVYKQKHSI